MINIKNTVFIILLIVSVSLFTFGCELTRKEGEIIDITLEEDVVRDISINREDNIVIVRVEEGTDKTNLTPIIEVPENYTIDPQSGISQNFTDSINYTIKCKDTDQKWEWIVNVEEVSIPSDGLQLWLRGDKGIETDNNEVIKWKDQSGNNNHAYGEEEKPKYISEYINDEPVISFKEDSSFLRVSHEDNLNADGSLSVFVVYEYQDHGRIIQKKEGSGTQDDAWHLMPNIGLAIRDQWLPDGDCFPTDENLIQSSIYNFDDKKISVYENGNSCNSIEEVEPQLYNTDDLYIGNRIREGSDFPYDGVIAEILIYNTALSEEDRIEVEEYLKNKYQF